MHAAHSANLGDSLRSSVGGGANSGGGIGLSAAVSIGGGGGGGVVSNLNAGGVSGSVDSGVSGVTNRDTRLDAETLRHH